MSVDDHTLGRQLFRYRQRLGISQEYLAEMLRLDQTYVSKTETGKRQLTVEEFSKWCEALNLADDEVLTVLKTIKK